MRYRYLVLDVFTDCRYGGNPLAVLPDAVGLDARRMQRIAAEFNLSETVFVLPASVAGRLADLRIFTPRAELPFAGHPTVGAALALGRLGRVDRDAREARFVLGEGAGPVPVTMTFEGDNAVHAEFAAPQAPVIGERFEPARIARALGIAPEQIVADGPMPVVASCGGPFVCAEVATRAALAAARFTDLDLLPGGEVGILVVTRDVGEVAADWRARMFAPAHGIPEDPATGSAAAALAGLLATAVAEDGSYAWRIAQGIEMGRPSLIETRAVRRNGRVETVVVGGGAVDVAEGWFEADE